MNHDSVKIRWEAPSSNNAAVTGYKIYLANKTIERAGGIKPKNEKGSRLVADLPADHLQHKVDGLQPSTVYYVEVFAVNKVGQGYPADRPQMIMTQPAAYNEPTKLYAWGSNSSSEIGLTDDMAEEHRAHYKKDGKEEAYLTKPVCHEQFGSMAFQVSCGPQQTLIMCADDYEQGEAKVTQVIQMGLVKVTKEDLKVKERDRISVERGIFSETQLYMLEEILSTPFECHQRLPVIKVACGHNFAAALSTTGEVLTWGANVQGQLGIDQERICYVRDGGHGMMPLQFIPTGANSMKQQDAIVDIAAGMSSMVALSETQQVYVWGERMGIYPSGLELSLACVEQKGNLYNMQEINQAMPRHVKNNLVFYEIAQLAAGFFNTALITREGQLLLHGSNFCNQLCCADEVWNYLKFFPEFKPIDFEPGVVVKSVAIGEGHIYALTELEGSQRIYGWGRCMHGQLFKGGDTVLSKPTDLTDNFKPLLKDGEKIASISVGGFHSLFLTSEGRVLGVGKGSTG